jgi:hypothetical protein
MGPTLTQDQSDVSVAPPWATAKSVFIGGGATRGAPTPRIDKIASEGLRLTNKNIKKSHAGIF